METQYIYILLYFKIIKKTKLNLTKFIKYVLYPIKLNALGKTKK